MQRMQLLVVGAVIAALAMAAIGVIGAGAATKTRYVVINGLVGKRVDICVDGKVKWSGVGFGTHVVGTVNNRRHRLKFVPAGRGCGATKLATRTIGASPGGGDYTVVLTNAGPGKVQVFDNAVVNEQSAPGDVGLAIRYAGDIGAVNIFAQDLLRQPLDPSPGPAASTTPAPWFKGDELAGKLEDVGRYRFYATKANKSNRFGQTPYKFFSRDKRTEYVLVGTKPKNGKTVIVKVRNRPMASPSPTP